MLKHKVIASLLLALGSILSCSFAFAEGCHSGDCTNGYGTYVFPDGSRYDGDFQNGQQHGEGVFMWSDKSMYAGNWQNGMMHGFGKFYDTEGRKKAGIWENGVFLEESVPESTEEVIEEVGEEFLGVDQMAPIIEITEPKLVRGFVVVPETNIIRLRGIITDPSGVESFSINGHPIQITQAEHDTYTFETKVSLRTGQNIFRFQAADLVGNTAHDKFYIQWKDQFGEPYIEKDESGPTPRSETEVKGSGRRTALVIGNGAYTRGPLKNAVNDADSVALELRKIGFEVLHYTDLDFADFEEVLDRYGRKLKEKGGVGLFYYAGHGVQIDGMNYLVPIGSDITRERDVKAKSVDLGSLMDVFNQADNSLNILVLDACRNNPFEDDKGSTEFGLAPVMEAPVGTFIAYSTAPGKEASDGKGANSLYTQEFLEAVRIPGLQLEDIFKKVRREVRTQTFGNQIPWENSSIESDFYFRK